MPSQEKGEGPRIEFCIPGRPQGKARARTVTFKNGYTHSYTPDKTVLYENLIKTQFAEAEKERGEEFYLGSGTPVHLKITAYFKPPASESSKRKRLMLMGAIMPLKKPDLDNVIKVVSDALNGLAYHDDTQVCYVEAYKDYDEKEHVDVVIDEYRPKLKSIPAYVSKEAIPAESFPGQMCLELQ